PCGSDVVCSMPINVPLLVLSICLPGKLHAIREESWLGGQLRALGTEDCPEAALLPAPPFPTVFELPYAFAKDINFMDAWVLKENSACSGEPTCEVSVAPHFDSQNPYNSTVRITIRARCLRLHPRQLFVCPKTAAGCIAAVRFPREPWRLRHLASFCISPTRMQRMDSMDNILQDVVLEGLFLLNLLVTLSVLFWLVREMLLLYMRPDYGHMETKVDAHLVIPSTMDIMLEGMLDAICFVIGCMLLLLAASTFLLKFGKRNNPTDVLLLSYPLLFGPAALARVFLCNCRRLLYHNLFQHGVMIDFSAGASGQDPLLQYTYVGFSLAVVVLIIDSVHCVLDGLSTWKGMIINVVVFTSPLYYMLSSVLNSLRLEKEAINRMCLQQLEKGTEAGCVVPSSEHKLLPISEGSFCRAARSREDLQVCIQVAKKQPNDDAQFGLRDMTWVPRLVAGRCKSTAFLLVVSMPVLALLAMTLGLASLAWLIKHRTDVPEITTMKADVPGLTPAFNYEVMEYVIAVPASHGAVSFTISADVDRTAVINASALDGNVRLDDIGESTSSMLSHHMPLLRKNTSYPTVIELTAATFSQARSYRVTAVELRSSPRSWMIAGETEDGQTYTRCITWKNHPSHVIAIPATLKSLRIEARFDESWFGIPTKDRPRDKFITSFYGLSHPLVRKFSCEGTCRRDPGCYEFKTTREGCYFQMGPASPRDMSCADLHSLQKFRKGDLELSARICNVLDSRACLQVNSSSGLISADISKFMLREKGIAVTFEALLSSGLSVYPEQPYKVQFYPGTVPVRELLLSGLGKIKERRVLADGTQQFQVRMSYSPMEFNYDYIQFYVAALVDDHDIRVEWDKPFVPANLSRQHPNFVKCQNSPQSAPYVACGGYLDSNLVEARMNKWLPFKTLKGQLVSKSHPHLFRPAKVQLNFEQDNGKAISPMQEIVRKNCSVPICRGFPEVYDCLEKTAEEKCMKDYCKDRCLDLASTSCRQEQEKLGAHWPYLGAVSSTMYDEFGPRGYFREQRFWFWLNVTVQEEYRAIFNDDVLADIAEHCSMRSGLLSLVRARVMGRPVLKIVERLLEALVRNPNLSMDGRFKELPALRAILDDQIQDFVSNFRLPVVVLHKPGLRPLTMTVCLSTDPSKVSFVNPDMYATVIDRLAVAVELNDTWEAASLTTAIHDLSRCVRTKRSRFQRFEASSCRSSDSRRANEDQTKPSLFNVAPSDDVFEDMFEVCHYDGVLEEGNSTILHVAAAKNFSKSFQKVMQELKGFQRKKKSMLRQNLDVNLDSWGTRTFNDVRLHFWDLTPLHAACSSGCVTCVKSLLAAKADPNRTQCIQSLPPWYGDSFHPWMFDEGEDLEEAKYAALEDIYPLHLAAKNRCDGCLQEILRSRVAVDAEMLMGMSVAALGAPLDLHSLQQSELTCRFRALDLAVLFNCSRCVDILLHAGANDSHVVLSETGGKDEFPLLEMLPKAKVQRCSMLKMQAKLDLSPGSLLRHT
ncbi:unnamed protein product, partial [Effrenium voratum]